MHKKLFSVDRYCAWLCVQRIQSTWQEKQVFSVRFPVYPFILIQKWFCHFPNKPRTRSVNFCEDLKILHVPTNLFILKFYDKYSIIHVHFFYSQILSYIAHAMKCVEWILNIVNGLGTVRKVRNLVEKAGGKKIHVLDINFKDIMWEPSTS